MGCIGTQPKKNYQVPQIPNMQRFYRPKYIGSQQTYITEQQQQKQDHKHKFKQQEQIVLSAEDKSSAQINILLQNQQLPKSLQSNMNKFVKMNKNKIGSQESGGHTGQNMHNANFRLSQNTVQSASISDRQIALLHQNKHPNQPTTHKYNPHHLQDSDLIDPHQPPISLSSTIKSQSQSQSPIKETDMKIPVKARQLQQYERAWKPARSQYVGGSGSGGGVRGSEGNWGRENQVLGRSEGVNNENARVNNNRYDVDYSRRKSKKTVL